MRLFRSFRGVPAASSSGARSRCGLEAGNAMACTLGDRSEGIANAEPVLVAFKIPDSVVERNGTILLRDKIVARYRA